MAARASEDCVGVESEVKEFAVRPVVGVDGLLGGCKLASLEVGLANDVSRAPIWRARFAGASLSGQVDGRTSLIVCLAGLTSLSLRLAFDWVRLRVLATGVIRPGSALKAEGWAAMESIFLNSAMWTSLYRPALPFGCANFRPASTPRTSPPFLAISSSLFAASSALMRRASSRISDIICWASGPREGAGFANLNSNSDEELMLSFDGVVRIPGFLAPMSVKPCLTPSSSFFVL